MSIVQGGPGLPILHPCLFQYLVSGELTNLNLNDSDVPDPNVRCMLQMVSCCISVIIML